MTASLHKLTAGDGYTYLTRQVAVTDSTERGRSSLADYYSDKGERPGRWLGTGVAGLGSVAVGDRVGEEQMRALFGEGRHPDADRLQKRAIDAGASVIEALKVSQLGRAYPVTKGDPTPFLVETQRRYQAYNAERGLRLNTEVPEEVRALIRTEVGRSTFETAHHRPPVDGQELTSHVTRQSRRAPQAVAGYDLTFTPVKSVSAWWAVAPRPVAEQIEAAHEAAMEHALGWLEHEVAYTRRGAQGVRQTEVEGVLAAVFTHRDSRAGDPNLHTHVAIANKVQARADGAWLSLDGASVYRAMVTVSEHYNSHLEAELVDRFGVEFVTVEESVERRPIREVLGVPADLLTAWSTRRAQIEAETARLAGEFVGRHSRAPSTVEMLALAQQANLATRQAKHEPRSLAEQRLGWREQAVTVLGSGEAVDAITTAVIAARTTDAAALVGLDSAGVDRVADQVVATVSRARARWQPTHVMAEAYRRLRPLGLAGDSIDAAVAAVTDRVTQHAVALTRADEVDVPAVLRRSDGTSMYEPAHTRLYTTTAVLKAEERIVGYARQSDGRTVDEDAVGLALLEAEANGTALNQGQIELVQALGGSGQRVQLAIAPAGSGKTTAMQVLARAWTDSGGTVVGLAPSAVAADELRAAVPGGTVDTLAQLAYALAPPPDTAPLPLPGWAAEIDQGTLVVIDEAGMAGTTELAAVIDFVIGRGGSVRLIGDNQQLAAVGAGGVLRDIQEAAGMATLVELMRFVDPAEAAATLAVRDGDATAVGFYLDHGRIHDTGDPGQSIIDAWTDDLTAGRSTVMITATRDAATTLNEKARRHRIDSGFVDVTGRSVTLRSGLPAAVGDEILTRRNDRRNRISGTDFVKNGDRWTILDVASTGAVQVQHQRSRKTTWLGADYVEAHVDHAYAVTVHSAQGSTVDVSHVLLDGTEDRQTAYVALSRGRVGNHLYVRSGGDGDPHTVIRPEIVRPNTGAEILAEVLGRDGAQPSATTTRRIETSAEEWLHQHTLRYIDGIFAAAEDLLGVEQMRLIDAGAEQVQPGVSECGGWPLLRMLLAVAQITGADPMAELERVRDERPLGDAHDVAAVLAWRLDDTAQFGGQGPLPWLRGIPQPLQDHPTWGPYLSARADRVTTYATYIHHHATKPPAHTDPPAHTNLPGQDTVLPRWVEPVRHHRQLWADLAVWRAANHIPDSDPIPAGASLKPSRERNYQHRLEARVKAVAPVAPLPVAVLQLLQEQAPGVVENPLWPFLARRLAAADHAGHDVVALVENALAEGPLPDELPAAALWFRLVGNLPPTTGRSEDTNMRLRPVWTDELLRLLPERVSERVLTDPHWADLVAAVTNAAHQTGLSETELVHQAVAGANLDPAAGGAATEAIVTTVLWRLQQLLQPPHPDGEEQPPDPYESDLAEPDLAGAHLTEADLPDADFADVGWVEDTPTADQELAPQDLLPEDLGEADEPVQATSRARLVELNLAAAAWWAQCYRDSSAAGYVHSRLGTDLVDDPRVSVGYAPPGWSQLVDQLRRTHHADDTELVDAGLAKWSRRGTLIDVMRDRVVFGIRDHTGDLVGFTGRVAPNTDPTIPKWLNTPTTTIFTKGQVLFGLVENQDRLTAGATPVRVEGVFDALAVTLAGNGHAIGLAPLGTALTVAQADDLVQAARDQTILYGTDNDAAGTKAAHRDYMMLAARGIDVRSLVLTDGQRTFNDPADAYTADQGTTLRSVLGAVDIAPLLASQLIADLVARDDHRDHLMAIMALARDIGPVIAAAPPEDWNNLLDAATTMIANAHDDRDNPDRYGEPVVTATLEAVESWELLRRALEHSTPAAPAVEDPEISYAVQARERLDHVAATLAAMRSRGGPTGPSPQPDPERTTETTADRHLHEEERRRQGQDDRGLAR